tara:strand:+ start:84 stop:299 length:216 start_codon:yes stop_codon:yes gene_type:complete
MDKKVVLIVEDFDVSQEDKITVILKGNGNPDEKHDIVGIQIGRHGIGMGSVDFDEADDIIEINRQGVDNVY